MLYYIPKKSTGSRICPANNLPSAKICVQPVGHGKIERADINPPIQWKYSLLWLIYDQLLILLYITAS
jgi:hypothetical protein